MVFFSLQIQKWMSLKDFECISGTKDFQTVINSINLCQFNPEKTKNSLKQTAAKKKTVFFDFTHAFDRRHLPEFFLFFSENEECRKIVLIWCLL